MNNVIMALKRVTIMIDEDLLKKLRNEQAKRLAKQNRSVSLSSVINDHLKKGARK